MELKGILSISGKNGLYKHVSQTKNGIIVESLIDKKRSPAYASAKISALEDIAIYTEDRDVPLLEVFQEIFKHEDGKAAINPKSSANELKSYFEKILADYDKDRVYVSDIKKVLIWYNILNEMKLIDLEKPEEINGEEEKKDSIEEAEIVNEKSTDNKSDVK